MKLYSSPYRCHSATDKKAAYTVLKIKENFAFFKFKKLELFYEKKWRKRKHLTNIRDFKNKLSIPKETMIKLL